jgi:hypothetical protein
VTKKGEPIRNAGGVRNTVNTGITYSMSFAEWQACIGCDLDLWAWESGVYPRWFKVRAMAYYNLTNLIELHTQDAVARKSEAMSKRKR